MLQNDEALYYGKPHRCYITPKYIKITLCQFNL